MKTWPPEQNNEEHRREVLFLKSTKNQSFGDTHTGGLIGKGFILAVGHSLFSVNPNGSLKSYLWLCFDPEEL